MGVLSLDQLPNELRANIVQAFGSFVIPLFLDAEPAGTGVLVEVDGVLGILTAEHVIFNPNKPLEQGQVLWTIPRAYPRESIGQRTNHPRATRIRTDLLRCYPSAPSRKDYKQEGAEWGPDLGFIRIPKPTNPEGNLRALRNVYSWAREPEGRMEKALKQDNLMLAVVGVPQEWIEDDPRSQPDQVAKRIKMGPLLTAQEKYWPDQNGYDFIDALAERTPDTPIPQSFKGISGGALWRLRDPFHADPPMPELTAGDYVLAGIVFWEDQQNANAPFMRSHGPRSVYEKFLPEVRAWLKETNEVR
jgi:hypothetical protein